MTLDRHATAIADKSKTVSVKFHDLFQKFVNSLVELNYPDGYLSDETSSVARGYWAFWNISD